jgi:hypothetical protein
VNGDNNETSNDCYDENLDRIHTCYACSDGLGRAKRGRSRRHANNCNNVGMAFGRANVMVEKKKGALSVDIERIPLMSGPIGKGGKLKAQSKMGSTSIAGLDGKFSIAGSVVEGTISLVFVAEYYVKDKALCTQSWNVSGMRKAG